MSNGEYKFHVDGVGYVVRFSNDAQLSFFTLHSDYDNRDLYDELEAFGSSRERYNDLGLTGVSSLQVFREVEKIAVAHIKKFKMNYVWFTCVPSRSSLYVRLAKHLSESVGLVVSNVNNTEFYLSK
jgi:hypothetical protein